MSKLVLVILALLLSGLIPGPPTTLAAVTYCVSSANQSCPQVCKSCHNLDYYIANSNELFSSNITMIFFDGVHATSGTNFEVDNLISLNMTGESQNVSITSVEFNMKVNTLHMSSITFQGMSSLRIRPFSEDLDSNHVHVMVVDCKFEEHSFVKTVGSFLTLSNCEFLHLCLSPSDNPLTVYHSRVNISGSKFVSANQTAILAFYSGITFDKTVDFINNTGVGGGALALYSTTLYFTNIANVSFINNRAITVGGAMYVDLGEIVRPDSDFGVFQCFYQVLSPLESSTFQVYFHNNSAAFGGEDIYGTSLRSSCQVSSSSSYRLNASKHFHFDISSQSSVSADPQRICICDINGKPQCTDSSNIFMTRDAYPGENITISIVVVGGDFGATIGTVYIGFLGHDSQHTQKVSQYQHCTTISHTLHPRSNEDSYAIMHLSTFPYDDDQHFKSLYSHKDDITRAVETYNKNRTISFDLITTPVYINIIFLECPPGFTLIVYRNKTRSCDCHMELGNGIQCHIDNNNVQFSWSSNAWIGVDSSANNTSINETNRVLYSENCPFDYCGDGKKTVDYMKMNDPANQCAFNRAGKLCGSCRDGYSLAIGSSRCIQCSNNNYLALLIFFVAAGFLLVLFISILNLTVAQGMINGLVFYANIVWAYQNIVLPQEFNTDTLNSGLPVLKIFLAWFNLDFGIETCFIRGLNGFWKTWLQFVFPFYTAGLFFVGLRFSSKLSKLFGDRSVPILATLLFMSCTKLLRTIIAALGLAQLKILSANDSTVSTSTVWSVDGNLKYGRHPHIYILLVAIACLLFLWLPYTLLLLLMQWLRMIPYSKPSQWITRYKPVFDTYYAPLKDKHHYWFGVLLLVQGLLLLISSLTSNIHPSVSLFLLLTLATLLLFYMSFMQVYHRMVVLITEGSFLINLILLVGGCAMFDGERSRMIMLYVSVSLAFLEFCGIVVWSLIKTYLKYRRGKNNDRLLHNQPNTSYTTPHEEQRDSDQVTQPTSTYVQFRDSILEDSLTVTTERELTYPRSSY